MKERLTKLCKAFKSVSKDEKNRIEFVRACEKVKKTHVKLNNLRLKILKTCLRDMETIGIPTTPKDKELMSKAIELYDTTLQNLKDEANQFREYLKS